MERLKMRRMRPRMLGLSSRCRSVLLRVLVLCAGLFGSGATGCLSAPVAVSATGVRGAEVDFTPEIPSLAVWQAVAAKPSSQHVANTEVVKFIIDRKDGKVYFLQSERWQVHYFFARRFLSTAADPIFDASAFSQREYHDADRRFILGTIARYLDAEVWALELFAGDELDLETTAQAFRLLKPHLFFGDKLRYRPVPDGHERALPKARSLMPVVTTDEIFGKVRYQPLELGEAYGYLRVFAKGTALAQATLRPFDIVVLGELPEEIPIVAGVLSDQLQAPLGHINVLCHNRNTPNMAQRGITADPRVRKLQGQLVHLIVSGQSFTLEPATQEAAERAWESRRPRKAFRPPRSDREVGMPLLGEALAQRAELSGAKASQLAKIAQVLPAGVVPRAFVLPFWAYATFLAANGFDRAIAALMQDPAFLSSPERRREALSDLRRQMEQAPVPPALIAAVLARIRQVLPSGAVRFRSSTNAEDLPGFNGAGLYRSIKVDDPASEAAVAQALKQVWASVWLWNAFEERHYYRIDHVRVAMAILVQASLDEVTASGVAVTANPFHQGQPGYFINAQAAAGSVTGAQGDEVPEQILYYTMDDTPGIERLSRSSRSERVLLSGAQVEELAGYLATIHRLLTDGASSMSGQAADVEFLVAKNGKIHIVQGRPYAVAWAGDRSWTWESWLRESSK